MKVLAVLSVGMLSLLTACGGSTSTTDTDSASSIIVTTDGSNAAETTRNDISSTTSNEISGIDGSGKNDGGIDGSGIDCSGNSCSTVIASGAIDAFGSIIVEGVRYLVPENTSVQSCGNQESITSDDLSLGMYIDLAGIRTQDGTLGEADQIDFCPVLCGTIEVSQAAPDNNVDNSLEKVINLLGKTVLVNSEETVFEGGTFETLTPGNQICAFGYDLAGELIFATRVQYQAVESVLFVATIEEILPGNGQLRMSNGLIVAIDGETEIQVSNRGVAVGLRVEVVGALNGTLVTASRIREDVSPLTLQLEPNQTLVVEGAIDIAVNGSSLSVEGLVIDLPNDLVQTPQFFNLEKGLQLRINAQNSDSSLIAQSVYVKRIEEEGIGT